MGEAGRGRRRLLGITAGSRRGAWVSLLSCAILLFGALEVIAKPRFSAIAVDARTGAVLFSKDPDGITHPASLTKVMTLYILFSELKAGRVKLDTQFSVSRAASAKAPSKLGLKPGQTIRVEDAIKGLVTRSANDAAAVIAENLAPSERDFAARMTRTAHSLGMSRTVFRNASGLPDPAQVTTARDIATLSLRIQRDFPEYYPYFRLTSFVYNGKVIRTHNRMLGRYPGLDGIKTGYVAASGFNLASSARHGDKRIIGVVMGASSTGSRNAYMTRMLDAAFPDCKDGTMLASAIEGVSPKTAEPDPEPEKQVADAEDAASATVPPPKPKKKPRVKLAKAAAPEMPSEHTASAEENGGIAETTPAKLNININIAALPDLNSSSAADAIAEVKSPAAEESAPETQAAPTFAKADAIPSIGNSAIGETVLSKTTPDGTPLPFAVKQPGDDAGGIVVTPAADVTWHIQIGAYPNKNAAQSVLRKLRGLDFDLLNDKEALTVEVQVGSNTLYRARFSGFTEQTARSACRAIAKEGFRCVPMQPQS
jgi:D-alanyl-D-alanine carboxypeptidase